MPESIEQRHSIFFGYYIVITAVVCGAIVMIVEVLGSRVIGPFFGVSLFVWTSLITVTLIALAAGYGIGGLLSDRKQSPDYLYGIIFFAGLLVYLIPLMKVAVLKTCMPFGLRFGSFVSSLLLFSPPLFLLGCVSPYIVKIAAREMEYIGSTVGFFYAVSTIGSVIGTVLTGFVLIAYFSVDGIFRFAGLTLIFISIIYFLVCRKKWFFLLFIITLFFLPYKKSLDSKIMPDGTRATKVFSRDSFYGNLKVVDYSYGAAHTRELIIDGLVQSGIDLANKMSVYEYPYLLEFLPYSLNPAGKTCLVIGLGPGIIPMWYENIGIKTDVVEINPNVPDIAKDYFGFKISGEVIISDARYYLLSSTKKYDYIILDVFSGDITPAHLLSLEAMELIKQRMNEKGILAINLVGSLKKEIFMTASVIKTVKNVFKTVEIYPVFSMENDEDGTGNLAVVAYDYPASRINPEIINDFPVHPLASSNVEKSIGRRFEFPAGMDAIILSDNYNPIDFYDIWLKEKVRDEILKTTDIDILL